MDCAKARFFLYAYFDREISGDEADALARHLADCQRCESRSRSARGLARVLHAHRDRNTAPHRLRLLVARGAAPSVRSRRPTFAAAAAVLIMILPLVTDDAVRSKRGGVSQAGILPESGLPEAGSSSLPLVSRRVTGTLVCLTCEAREEAGLCPLPGKHPQHETALCADDGEVWRLMSRDPSFLQAGGQTVTVEGIAFPRSGFLRASRVGY